MFAEDHANRTSCIKDQVIYAEGGAGQHIDPTSAVAVQGFNVWVNSVQPTKEHRQATPNAVLVQPDAMCTDSSWQSRNNRVRLGVFGGSDAVGKCAAACAARPGCEYFSIGLMAEFAPSGSINPPRPLRGNSTDRHVSCYVVRQQQAFMSFLAYVKNEALH